jgi:hypothetical protein
MLEQLDVTCEFTDGRIQDPTVHVESLADDAVSSAQARRLAAEILDVADEIDAWA